MNKEFIKKIEINPRKKSIIAYLDSSLWEEALLEKEKIKNIFPEAEKVFLLPCYSDCNALILQKFCETSTPWLKMILDELLPFSQELNLDLSYNQDLATFELGIAELTKISQRQILELETNLVKILSKIFPQEQHCKYISKESVQDKEGFLSTILLMEQELIESITTANEDNEKSEIKNSQNADVILGDKIQADIVMISDITDEEKKIAVQGEMLNLSIRKLKSNNFLVTFELFDRTGGIGVKLFLQQNQESICKVLEKAQCLKIQGAVKYDTFQQDLVINANSLNVYTKKIATDDAAKKRVELHLHTNMSAMDGISATKEIMNAVAAIGHRAVAITDHGVVQAYPDAFNKSKELGIKVIYGVEGYLINDLSTMKEKSARFHIIILAKNKVGLKNLYKLISLSHINYFYRRPRMPREELESLREGLIFGSACEAGEVFRAILEGKSEYELDKIANFYDYLEIQPIGNNDFLLRNGLVANRTELEQLNVKILQLGKRLGKPVVATGDVHFLSKDDAIYRQILMAAQGYADADMQAPLYYRTTEEMLNEFKYLAKEDREDVVINYPNQIADEIEDFPPYPNQLFPPVIAGAEQDITKLCIVSAKNTYGEKLPKLVQDRLDKEMNSIVSNGYAVLYLIAHKLVKKSNEDGYLVGSRGSVGSSFVANLIGITEVNPLPPHYLCPDCNNSEFFTEGEYRCGIDMPNKNCPACGELYRKDGFDIPFETFLGFKGDKVPDIDLNFSGEYQGRIHKYTEELLGAGNVFKAGTISTVADKTAYGFVKKYCDEAKIPMRNSAILGYAKGITGIKKTTGQHPGGLIVVPEGIDIYDFTPVQRPADDAKSDVVTTHFDYHSIDNCLVKLDLLGHVDPTAIKMLEDLTGIDAKTIPLDDADTMSIFSSLEKLNIEEVFLGFSVGALGIPEFGTKFVRQILEDTKPTKFSELVCISGFSHGTDVWLNNAQDLIKSGTTCLNSAISTRDDIMIYLIQKKMEPALAFKIMEFVRKGNGLTEEFQASMREFDVPEWYIESCKKIKYMFPKAHAVAYVTMAFRIAYFKVHFPESFYATYFSVRADEFDADLILQGEDVVFAKLKELEGDWNTLSTKDKNVYGILEIAYEMFKRNIKMRKVNIWLSDATRFKLVEHELLPPFNALQGVGINAAYNIVDARNSKLFSSIEDLSLRAKLGKSVIETLQNHGSLEGLDENDQLSLF
ncbi:MAG: PolC-type DNA polymerase III [Clostridia bacterium]